MAASPAITTFAVLLVPHSRMTPGCAVAPAPGIAVMPIWNGETTALIVPANGVNARLFAGPLGMEPPVAIHTVFPTQVGSPLPSEPLVKHGQASCWMEAVMGVGAGATRTAVGIQL